MRIIDRQRRLHEVGRIRLGEQVATSSGKKRPAKLETFRFTSANHDAISAIAGIHGGAPAEWADAPTGRQWEVTTDTDRLRVMVVIADMSFSQAYEIWSGGGCVRRCDGERMQGDLPCACDPDSRECKPHTRVSVMLADLPTTGLWRFDTSSEYAADELAGAFDLAEMIGNATGQKVLTATVRIDQREKKRPGEPTKKFGVPVVEFDIDVSAFVGSTRAIEPAMSTPQLVSSITPIPRDEAPTPTIAEQISAVDTPEPRKQTARSAATLPASGLSPRPAADAARADAPSQGQMRRLFALLGGKKIKTDEERHSWASQVLGRPVSSFTDLSSSDMNALMDDAEGVPVPNESEYQDQES